VNFTIVLSYAAANKMSLNAHGFAADVRHRLKYRDNVDVADDGIL
jgi:hypothetical protein